MRRGVWTERRLLSTAALQMALLVGTSWARIGGGSSRVPLTDFLIECYNVSEQVYAPFICLAVILVGALNMAFGWVRLGPIMGRIIMVIGILGLGVTWFLDKIGGNLAMALLGQ
jgi:MFS superfamily sulfate permease-like transporter